MSEGSLNFLSMWTQCKHVKEVQQQKEQAQGKSLEYTLTNHC